jgi:hypothetical protein
MADKKLTTLQDEIKLLKGEVKQSLASVRDYLLNMELPSSEISTILAALGTDGEQKVSMKGSFEMPNDKGPEDSIEQTEEEVPSGQSETTEEELPPEDDIFTTEETIDDGTGGDGESPFGSVEGGEGGGEAPSFGEEDLLPDGDIEPDYEGEEPDEEAAEGDEAGEPGEDEEENLPEDGLDDDEGEPVAMDNYSSSEAEILSSVPKVNMMANLINWVSRAARDIGYEQLPVFLEVYGVSGHLSPEMKDVILHLAELTNDKPEVETSAGVWSEQMLSLHGILTGGETPLHPVIPSWGTAEDISDQISDEEIMDPDAKDKDEEDETPVKLKLVFPNGDGEAREYSIDLSPGMATPVKKQKTDK